MKTIVFILLILIPNILFAQENLKTSILRETLIPFFSSLQTGDTEALNQLTGSKMAERAKKLRYGRRESKSSLRAKFSKSRIHIDTLSRINDTELLAEITIRNADRTLSKRKIVLKKNNDDNIWKIADQIMPGF